MVIMDPILTGLGLMLAGKVIDEVFSKWKRFEKYKGLFSWIAMAGRVFIKK